jgi:TolB-like protein/Tfp pilus assembly protein PilF
VNLRQDRTGYRLTLFGSASIDGPDGPVTGRPVQRRRLGLLALLAIGHRNGVTRDRLIGYLWPDSDPERARHLLSDSVYRINQAVGGEALSATGDRLILNPERLPTDVWDFADAIERGLWEHAVALHTRPLLDGFFLTDADELEHWVCAQRERLARDRNHALEALAEKAEHDGNFRSALHWWRVLAGHDAYSSRIALRLLRALDRAGERAAALQHAHAHTLLLEEELGLAPDAELLAFVAELRAPAPCVTVPAPTRHAVAVLPFVNLSADPENEYFVDGITEDVIAHLAKISTLSVISSTSVMPFKGRPDSLQRIAALLGATTVVDGSVRRDRDRVRIVAKLIDAASDRHVWADTYDRQLTDIFAIQSDVAIRIAAALRAELSLDEQERIRQEPTDSMEAYELYLKGRSLLIRFTTSSMERAIGYFERALAADPSYALAHASIAIAYTELCETGTIAPDVARPPAAAAVAAALRHDPASSEAHTAAGRLRSLWEFDWEGAEAAFRRAVELSPSNADAYDFYGRMCHSVGRFEEALALIRRAQQLDPLAHSTDVANALLRAGRYDEAAVDAARAVEFEPQHARARATLGWAFIKQGKADEGLAELEHAVELEPETVQWLAQLGQARAITGDPAAAREILRQLERRAATGYVSPYHLAFVYTGLGEHERAIDLLEQAVREGSGSVYGVSGSFLFAPLRDHARFQALVGRINPTGAT